MPLTKNRLTASLLTVGAALSFALAGAQPATAASSTLSFELTTVVDATAVGGAEVTPLRVIYQFHPELAPGSGYFGAEETFATYGPLEKVIVQVGKECVALPGLSGNDTFIGVFDNAGTTFIEDSYAVFAWQAAVAGQTLLRQNLEEFRAVLIDEQATMFSDTSLPTSEEFAASADILQIALILRHPRTNEQAILSSGLAPFQLFRYDLTRLVNDAITDIRALPVSSDLIAALVTPLERARTLVEGNLTQKNINQARGALEEFSKVAQTNRNELGKEAAENLKVQAEVIALAFPACA
jgi:hypothetical protein